jgi:hypothetical protein
MILNQRWPLDLDPAQAGFKTRTITILRRHGYWDDPTRLDALTGDEFLAIETVGPVVLADLVEKGNAAIEWHENLPPDQRRRHSLIIHWDAADRQKLRRLADRVWTHQVWRRDPRFADLLPEVDATVAEIATSGSLDDRKALLRNLLLLQDRLAYYRSRREESLRVFVSGITGQTGKRLEVLLAMVGFTQPRITQKDGARRLGVSRSRTQQLVKQLWRAWDKAAPTGGCGSCRNGRFGCGSSAEAQPGRIRAIGSSYRRGISLELDTRVVSGRSEEEGSWCGRSWGCLPS